MSQEVTGLPLGKRAILSVFGSFWLWSCSLKRPVSISDLTGPVPGPLLMSPQGPGQPGRGRVKVGWQPRSFLAPPWFPWRLLFPLCTWLRLSGSLVPSADWLSTPHKPALVLPPQDLQKTGLISKAGWHLRPELARATVQGLVGGLVCLRGLKRAQLAKLAWSRLKDFSCNLLLVKVLSATTSHDCLSLCLMLLRTRLPRVSHLVSAVSPLPLHKLHLYSSGEWTHLPPSPLVTLPVSPTRLPHHTTGRGNVVTGSQPPLGRTYPTRTFTLFQRNFRLEKAERNSEFVSNFDLQSTSLF